MGQRANLVIVKDGDWKLYYDHWCANRLDVELFWGPELATQFVEQRRPLEDRTDWLDDVWSKGGALIDHDRKTLVWYGGEDILHDILERRVLLDLMQKQWPGWTIRWAHEGIAELGAYFRIPVELFLARDAPDPSEAVRLIPERAHLHNLLLTVRADGSTTAARVFGDEEALQLGVEQLPSLLAFERHSTLDWTENMPTVGLHVEVDLQRIDYWCARPVEAIEPRVQRGWPGWKTNWLCDRFEEHLRIAGIKIRLPVRSPQALQIDLLSRLRQWLHHAAHNPARELAERRPMNVNPWTDEARGSVGPETEKLRIVDNLEKTLFG